jgi:hypothetical protein
MFLEEETRGTLTPNGFFNNDGEANLAINGVYGAITNNRSLFGGFGNLTSITIYGADDVGLSRARGNSEPYENFSISETTYGTLRDNYIQFYSAVNNLNTILENVPGNENLTEGVRNRVEGEALFLRALMYYHMTNIWGDVVYLRNTLPLSESATLGRFDEEQIRQDMIADLNDVLNRGLLDDVQVTSGRPTRWAALMLKAKLMQWLATPDWQGILEATTEIINNSPHALLSDYGAIWVKGDNDPYHAENIWGFDFLKDIPGNIDNNRDGFNPRLRDEPANPAERNALGAALAERGEEFNGFGHIVCLPEFARDFPQDDLRRPWNVGDEYLGFQLRYAYLPKFWTLDFVNSPRNNHGDFQMVYRLADTYLMAAEAANELGNDGEALEYLNAVRERAYEPDQPLSVTGNALRQAIRDERRWELAAEGHRRYDLVRWGILVETIRNTTSNVPGYDRASNVSERNNKFPIPIEEIVLNPNLLESDPTNNGYR